MKLPRFALSIFLPALFLGLSSIGLPADPEPAPEPAPKPRDLGPPLVDNLKDLKQFDKFPAWLDAKNKKVVLVCETCKADYPLEFFITTKDRAYESVLVVDANRRGEGKASLFQNIQAALFLLGAKQGHPAYYSQKDDKTFVATGDEIMIEVRWKNKEGKTEKTDARNWIRDVKTKKSPEKTWVFGGSRILDDGEGHKHFMADGGEFVCVVNNPMAMFDLPLVSSTALEDRPWRANLEMLPPEGTPVTIVLTPKLKPKDGGKK